MHRLKNWARLVIFDLEEGKKEMSRNVMGLRSCGDFRKIDRLLDAIDVTLFPERFLVTVLIATAPCLPAELKSREDFKARVRQKMINNCGDEARVDEELRGL